PPMYRRHPLSWLTVVIFLFFPGAAFTGGKDDKKPEEKKEFPKEIDIKGESTVSYKLTLPADKLVEFWVESKKDTDVDLFVYDPQGALVGSDTRVSKDCYLSWITSKGPKEQTFKIEVKNLGKEDNHCKLKWVARPLKRTEYKKIELKGQGKEEFKIEFKAGQKVHFLVDSEKDTDVDLFVFYVEDGKEKEVAADRRLSKDCYVWWVPDKTRTYRIQ